MSLLYDIFKLLHKLYNLKFFTNISVRIRVLPDSIFVPDPDTGYIRSVKTGSGLSCRISECAGYRIKPDTGYRIFKYSKCYKYYRTISFQMIMASNGGDNGGIDPPEDLYLVPSLGIERSKNTDLFNFNGKNHVQTPVSRANCVLKGGAKKNLCCMMDTGQNYEIFFCKFHQ